MKKILIISMIVLVIFGCGKKGKKSNSFNKILKMEEERLKEEKKKEEVIEPKKEIVQEEKVIEEETIKEEIIKKEISSKKYAPKVKSELSVAEMWSGYKESKANLEIAKKQDDFEQIISSLINATKYAKLLKREDIAAWQLNNIGFYSIEEFKKRTNYFDRMNRMNTMASGEDKKLYLKSTKDIIQIEFSILKDAKKFLNEAKEIDKNLNDQNRTKIIGNNLDFINEIQRFID
ncbi:MAG: hypothetical protein K8S23_08910 [Candidatus Cloacimonetes bacterium]|nr:hypothetical protein [Candidatus Cloacimonadota bacterium]